MPHYAGAACGPMTVPVRFRATVRRAPVEHKPDPDDTRRSKAALAIWGSAKRAQGTLVEVYLASRGIHLAAPVALRFHPGLKHPSGGIWPAMVALVTRGSDGKPLAIHRTYLAHDGIGKAPVAPQKMMLGPCHGGAVRLAKPGDVLMVGEGIETCLAAMQATGHPAWAALSTSGLRALDLPGSVREVIVLADGDDPGEAAARGACAGPREGRRVRIARPLARPLRKNSTAGEKFGFGPVIWVRWPGEPSLARLPGVRIVMVRA